MENISAKERFLKESYIPLLQQIPLNAQAVFGKMNVLQMMEHMAEYLGMAYGNPPQEDSIKNPEIIAKTRQFLFSEQAFKPNTPNALMPDTPAPSRFNDKEAALLAVQQALDAFFDFFSKNPDALIQSPFFGMLNFHQSIQLLYKHSRHHLVQFNALND